MDLHGVRETGVLGGAGVKGWGWSSPGWLSLPVPHPISLLSPKQAPGPWAGWIFCSRSQSLRALVLVLSQAHCSDKEPEGWRGDMTGYMWCVGQRPS